MAPTLTFLKPDCQIGLSRDRWCGDGPVKKVILATTGWEDAERTGKLEKAKEHEIVDNSLPVIETSADNTVNEDTKRL
jgi:hypothetical protein